MNFLPEKYSFQLKCFYKTVTIPTQNSTIRARKENTILALCKKEKVVLFNKECDSKGMHLARGNGAATCLVALLAFATTLPAQSDSV